MNIAYYDSLLRNCRSVEDWQKYPHDDVVIFSIFGTVAPKILHRSHRLIPYGDGVFEMVLSTLGAKGALFGRVPPSIASMPPKYSLGGSLPLELDAWKEERNQKWLTREVKNLKFTSSNTLIFDANSDVETVSYLTSKLPASLAGEAWFATVDELADRFSWLYLPLPELVGVDLLIFERRLLASIRSAFDALGFTEEAKWDQGRITMPIELPVVQSKIWPSKKSL